MSKGKIIRLDSNCSYNKEDITIDMSEQLGYPLIEKTNNALLFPEGPKEKLDIKGFKEKE